MENKLPIAVIAKDFKRFRYDILQTDLNLLKISSVEDTRGRSFSGYIVNWDAIELDNLDEIIYWVKARIKN